MNILFDLITPQGFIGGAGEYVRRIYYALTSYQNTHSDVNIICLFDSNIGRYAYKDLSPSVIKNPFLFIEKRPLEEIVNEYKIDTIFIGALQYWSKYSFEGVRCRIVSVIHDLCEEELLRDKIKLYTNFNNVKGFIKILTRNLIDRVLRINNNRNESILEKDNLSIVTVSEYSKATIIYNYPHVRHKIKVFYSPTRITNQIEFIENPILNDLIVKKKKYYLILGCNRELKNTEKAIFAFKKYLEYLSSNKNNDLPYLVTIGCNKTYFTNQIILPYLSESDLDNAYKNCYALIFPSLFEGFGYPPIEIMRYGKPVLASNVTSIPEICGDAPLYFSPLYESDILRCLIKLNSSNYRIYSEKSKERFTKIKQKQENDLDKLITLITKQDE